MFTTSFEMIFISISLLFSECFSLFYFSHLLCWWRWKNIGIWLDMSSVEYEKNCFAQLPFMSERKTQTEWKKSQLTIIDSSISLFVLIKSVLIWLAIFLEGVWILWTFWGWIELDFGNFLFLWFFWDCVWTSGRLFLDLFNFF